MFVKKFHSHYIQLSSDRRKGVALQIFDMLDDFFESNPELNYAKKEFEELLKQNVCKAIFSYFPELKPEQDKLTPKLEKIIQEHSEDLFQSVFDIIYMYLDKPDRSEENIKWDFHLESEEEIIAHANESGKNIAEPDRAEFIRVWINSCKNAMYFRYFDVVLHKSVLACVTEVFLEIPDLPGNGIRYLNYAMAADTYLMKDDFYGLFVEKLVAPYNES